MLQTLLQKLIVTYLGKELRPVLYFAVDRRVIIPTLKDVSPVHDGLRPTFRQAQVTYGSGSEARCSEGGRRTDRGPGSTPRSGSPACRTPSRSGDQSTRAGSDRRAA